MHAKTKTRQLPFNHSIIVFPNLLRILSNLGVYRSHNNLIFLLLLILNKLIITFHFWKNETLIAPATKWNFIKIKKKKHLKQKTTYIVPRVK